MSIHRGADQPSNAMLVEKNVVEARKHPDEMHICASELHRSRIFLLDGQATITMGIHRESRGCLVGSYGRPIV